MNGVMPAFCCPQCRVPLAASPSSFGCAECGRRFPTVDGVPVLTGSDEDVSKRQQAKWFDHETDEEFEITRPHGTPRLYQWYYREKFERSVIGISSWLDGGVALTVCGGSGMDAEFLARRGAHVICSDISLGAARRARERASRYGVEIVPIVADAEKLPFDDQSIDVVFVHDGLHHLVRPFAALREMARISRYAISITEPARAAATAVAVRLGVALNAEEAGNRVERFRLDDVIAVLHDEDFEVTVARRYALYHKHEPGRVISALSRGPALAAVKLAVLGFNAVAGRTGNKLTIQAVRHGPRAGALGRGEVSPSL